VHAPSDVIIKIDKRLNKKMVLLFNALIAGEINL